MSGSMSGQCPDDTSASARALAAGSSTARFQQQGMDVRARVKPRHMNTDLQFLLSLDTAVRPLVDPGQITMTVATHLGRFLRVNRCAYAEVGPDADTINLTDDYNDGVPSIVGRYRLIDFGAECSTSLHAGRQFARRSAFPC